MKYGIYHNMVLKHENPELVNKKFGLYRFREYAVVSEDLIFDSELEAYRVIKAIFEEDLHFANWKIERLEEGGRE